jgi:hypothetical protein
MQTTSTTLLLDIQTTRRLLQPIIDQTYKKDHSRALFHSWIGDKATLT